MVYLPSMTSMKNIPSHSIPYSFTRTAAAQVQSPDGAEAVCMTCVKSFISYLP